MHLKKFHIILLMTLGLLLSPGTAFACGHQAEGHRTETPESCGMECCKKEKDSRPSNKDHHDCDGKCRHSSCNCASVCSFAFTVVPTVQFKHEFVMISTKKREFVYSEAFFTSSIDSLRLPPKIS